MSKTSITLLDDNTRSKVFPSATPNTPCRQDIRLGSTCFLRQPIKNEVARGCGLDCLTFCLACWGKCLMLFVDLGRLGNECLLRRLEPQVLATTHNT